MTHVPGVNDLRDAVRDEPADERSYGRDLPRVGARSPGNPFLR